MNGYQHLGLDERRQVYQLAATGRSVQQIAAALQRHRSTIYRELKRNRHLDDEPLFRGYFPTAAQTMADRRRVRGGKIARKPELAAYIADRLSAAWSPEQIAGYLRRHRGNREANGNRFPDLCRSPNLAAAAFRSAHPAHSSNR